MVLWCDGDVLSNGLRLHYYRSGGDKPPIVLAHGITDSGLCWPLVSRALAPRYDIIAVDARGHGKSDKPESGYAREAHADDLAALIEALDLDRPAVLGHSMGAGSSSVLAYRYPALVGALLLEDPPWRSLDASAAPPAHAAEWGERIRARKALSIEELTAEGTANNPRWSPEEFDAWARAKHQVSPNVVGYVGGGTSTWLEIIQGIQCPTLLITGEPELDAIVTPEMVSAVVGANPNIQMVHIAGAGHNVRRDQFAAYMDAVEAFLAVAYPAE